MTLQRDALCHADPCTSLPCTVPWCVPCVFTCSKKPQVSIPAGPIGAICVGDLWRLASDRAPRSTKVSLAAHKMAAASHSRWYFRMHPHRQRLKLSHLDVRLILYLIVQIKPFKYVGDRTLSQSRKWELIKLRFEQHKLMAGETALASPTVRTLQRQMAAALRNAQQRRPLTLDSLMFLRLASLESPLEELEFAVLELNNLSEAYKTGQPVGTTSEHDDDEDERPPDPDADLLLVLLRETRTHHQIVLRNQAQQLLLIRSLSARVRRIEAMLGGAEATSEDEVPSPENNAEPDRDLAGRTASEGSEKDSQPQRRLFKPLLDLLNSE